MTLPKKLGLQRHFVTGSSRFFYSVSIFFVSPRHYPASVMHHPRQAEDCVRGATPPAPFDPYGGRGWGTILAKWFSRASRPSAPMSYSVSPGSRSGRRKVTTTWFGRSWSSRGYGAISNRIRCVQVWQLGPANIAGPALGRPGGRPRTRGSAPHSLTSTLGSHRNPFDSRILPVTTVAATVENTVA